MFLVAFSQAQIFALDVTEPEAEWSGGISVFHAGTERGNGS
jgi:hypothetical protein